MMANMEDLDAAIADADQANAEEAVNVPPGQVPPIVKVTKREIIATSLKTIRDLKLVKMYMPTVAAVLGDKEIDDAAADLGELCDKYHWLDDASEITVPVELRALISGGGLVFGLYQAVRIDVAAMRATQEVDVTPGAAAAAPADDGGAPKAGKGVIIGGDAVPAE
jgi:hypothetical protein